MMTPNASILCLSPHPDDTEISISGTISKFSNCRFDIYVLSCGNENENHDFRGETRYSEVKNFWSAINCNNINLNFSDEKYITNLREDQWINKIEKIYNIKDYDVILIPPLLDNHCEHRTVNSVGKSLVRSNQCALIEYQTPSTMKEWIYNLAIETSIQVFNKKVLCLEESFKHQLEAGRNYFSEEYLNILSTDYVLNRKKVKHVEKFKILESYL